MRRTGIRRKRKKKDSPAWYKMKVVEAFMKSYRGNPCAVCGATEGTVAHHIVSRGSCPHHIATPNMVIPLCKQHHRFAHGDRFANGDAFAVCEFLQWLADRRPKQYEWCMAHRHDTALTCGKIDWQARYEAMEEAE